MRSSGRYRSDYAGMSSYNTCENHVRRKSKGSWGRFILPGLVGPKLRSKGVGDGQQVNIPVLLKKRLSKGVTQEATQSPDRLWGYKLVGRMSR